MIVKCMTVSMASGLSSFRGVNIVALTGGEMS